MKRFSGRLAPDGKLVSLSPDEEAGGAETHLGCRVLACGYIADREELAKSLDVSSESASDAELLAHAYRRWGSDLQARVPGEFAVFIFDEVSNSTTLTHDALGLVPLFYRLSGDGLSFATHLIDLAEEVSDETLDQEYLADFMAAGFFTSERTPYPSVKRLPPGMTLRFEGGRVRHLRTWDLARVRPIRCRDDGEYAERFRELLTAGVRASLRTEGAAWISLSGGLDSSSVACVAARQGARRLGAYSLVMPRFPEGDESRWMRAVVEHCGIDWHPVDVETVLPFSTLPDGFPAEPTTAIINSKRRRLTNELFSSHGVTTLLTGDGGDAVLGAWSGVVPPHLSDPLFSGDPLGTLSALKAWAEDCAETRSWSYWMLRGVIEPTLDHLRDRQIQTGKVLPLPEWIEPQYAKENHLLKRDRKRMATRCKHPGRQQIWDRLWAHALSVASVPSHMKTYSERAPLLYRPLVEFMFAIPWEQKLRPRCDRFLQRRALKGVLPETVRRRAYKAIGTWPFVEGLRRSKLWVEYLCDSPKMAELGLARRDEWRKAVKQATLGQTHGDRFFLTGVALEAWLKELSAWRTERKAKGHLRGDPILRR